MSEPFESIRSIYRSLDPASVLEKPTSSLLGVSQSAASTLGDVGIATVFDLASSALFANAVDICLLAESGEGRFAAIGKVPHDVLRDGHDQPLTDLPLQPISILSTYSSKTKLDALATALDIASIRDLAAWPPYRTARKLLDQAYNPLAMAGVLDQEAPIDLIPANGQYPTERIQYEVLLFDEFVGGPDTAPTNLRQLGEDGAVDVSQLLSTDGGYERPAIGGILTFTQSWYTKALALGNLIHGVALAPGESTKIAMIDWSRRVRTSAAEAIQEQELLVADLSRSRAISEITRAVARETQEGQSAAQSFSTATQRGESTGSASFRDPSLNPLEFIMPGVNISGSSFGTSTSSTSATAWSTSSGQREVGASLVQDIVDRTQQAAHSARNRRASIVREVSQQESEAISTRTLTNYNHMHALTVEYYEVVQLYRTVVELSKADRCLFVPMKLVDFTQPRIVDRYRHVIAANGLRDNIRTLSMADPDRLALWATRRVGSWDAAKLEQFSRYLGITVGAPTDAVLSFPKSFSFVDVYFNSDVPFSSLIATLVSGEIVKIPLEVEPGPGGPLSGKLHTTGGVYRDPSQIIFKSRLGEIRRVEAQKKDDSTDFSGKVTVNLFDFSEDPRIDGPFHFLSWSMNVSAEETSVVLFELQPTITTKELTQHLEDNRLYYSQVIWRALDPATIGIMLAGYTWLVDGQPKPLVELVDPAPVAIVANYLVFRMSGDDAEEKDAWLLKKKITVGSLREDLVPVPSGGVFAEAVLGRFNSAEKLDITRFWNWQDSPIPIQAPDIAAIQTGSRRDPDTTTPGQLGAPVLNIVNPPALPDPQGMGAILAAIQNGNMFRDMSGLAATIGLAQAGLAGAQQGASDAATQAGQNAAVAAQLGAKVAELVAKLVEAYITKGASMAAGSGAKELASLAGGISGQGAKLNHGKDMDKRGIPAQTSGSVGTDTPPASDSGTGEGSGGGSTGSGTSGAPAAGNESAAFNTALGGGQGGFFDQILKTVLGATPPVVKPLSVPRIRWCCQLGLQWGIEPVDVKDHKYGSTSVDNCGFVYTERAGLLDIGHLRDHIDLTKYVYDAISAGYSTIPCREGTATLTQSPSDPIATAQAIAYNDSWSHELISFKGSQDFSAFAPEDLPSNFLGTYIGAQALAMSGSSGSFDAIVDTLLAGLLASLGARSKADTDTIITSLKKKWWEHTLDVVPVKLLKRNFESTPWLAGTKFDKPPVPPFIDASTLTPLFTSFDYTSKPLADGSIAKHMDFPAITGKMRAPFRAQGTDKP